MTRTSPTANTGSPPLERQSWTSSRLSQSAKYKAHHSVLNINTVVQLVNDYGKMLESNLVLFYVIKSCQTNDVTQTEEHL